MTEGGDWLGRETPFGIIKAALVFITSVTHPVGIQQGRRRTFGPNCTEFLQEGQMSEALHINSSIAPDQAFFSTTLLTHCSLIAQEVSRRTALHIEPNKDLKMGFGLVEDRPTPRKLLPHTPLYRH